MTCREFNRIIAPLRLWEVAHSRDERVLAHGQECRKCGSWLEQQRNLAGAIHTLRVRTETVQAGPAVEAAVLRSFRQHAPAAPEKPAWFAPFALRLSRWFEIGAYAAAVAAAVVGLAGGVWYWQHRVPPTTPGNVAKMQVQQESPAAVTADHVPGSAGTNEHAAVHATAEQVRSAGARNSRKATNSGDPTVAQAEQKQGYIDLMLCDPLICSGDEEVVRMELPASSVNTISGSSQPLMADVVVGDDGLVRAVRIVQ